MPSPRLIRGLRIAWSVWWGILCVLFVVLWVRTYCRIDLFWGPVTTRGQIVVVSMRGRVFAGENYGGRSTQWSTQSGNLYAKWRSASTTIFPARDALGFALVADPNSLGMVVPYWFAVLVAAIFAKIPWAHWSKRFSVRTLLIATTLIAVVLGLVVWSSS
jgi:hypothetical protein